MECHQLPWTAKDDFPGHLQGVGTSERACSLQGVAFIFNVFLVERNKKKGIMPLRKGVSSLRKSLDHWILDFFLALHLLYSEKECFYVVFSNSLARSPVTNSGQKKTSSEKSPVICSPSHQSAVSTIHLNQFFNHIFQRNDAHHMYILSVFFARGRMD